MVTQTEAWFTELQNYVTTMKERCPYVADHPPVEWLTHGVSMISLDHGQSVAPVPAQGGLAAVKSVVRAEYAIPISDMQRKLVEHTKRHTGIELNNCQFQLSQ